MSKKCYLFGFTHLSAALPLASGDEGQDEEESSHNPSKSKFVKSSKKKKSSKTEKKKIRPNPEKSSKEPDDPAADDIVSHFSIHSNIVIYEINSNIEIVL